MTNTADGLPSSMALGGSGDTLNTSYDSMDSPSSITLSNSSTLQEFAYSDEPSGAIASETDTPSSSIEPASYTYDSQSRVTQMTPGSSSTLSYGYDASGNPTSLPNGAATTSYGYASELKSWQVGASLTRNLSYDANGNRTATAATGYSPYITAAYNGANQLAVDRHVIP